MIIVFSFGGMFYGRLECIEKHTKLELNCNLKTKDYTPDWYNGENLNAYVTAVENQRVIFC